MPAFDSNLIAEYNKTRSLTTDRSILCHAPFTNINFEQTGKATACCYNRKHVLGTYPVTSIKELWYGQQAEALRDYIRHNDLGGGCRMCALQLESKNYSGFKAKLYDEYAPATQGWLNKLRNVLPGQSKVSMPRVMEFELENTCNLECIMCNGNFSSTIRKNREKKPALVSPYDQNFVTQLEEFIPHLTDMKFLGGEPFMIDIYYDIWERVAKLNPSIKIHITTNATMLNSRTKRLLEAMLAGINISIDSVQKETYEAIRIGAVYERVMDNLDWLLDYTKRQNTYLSFSVCPMVINRWEIPGIVAFANERNIHTFFNTVWWPEEQSLRFLKYEELNELIKFYEQNLPLRRTPTEIDNYEYFMGFLNQVRFWRDEKEVSVTPTTIPDRLVDCIKRMNPQSRPDKPQLTKDILMASIISVNPEAHQYLTEDSALYNTSPEHVKSFLTKVSQSHALDGFLVAYFDCLEWIASEYLPADEFVAFQRKVIVIHEAVKDLQEKELMVSDLIRSGVLYQVNYIAVSSEEEIKKTVKEHYN